MELDERTGVYHDIGDKKALAKTSQALREGQTKLRKKLYSEMNNVTTPIPLIYNQQRAAPLDYFGYSQQLLEALYQQDRTRLLMAQLEYPRVNRRISPSPTLKHEVVESGTYGTNMVNSSRPGLEYAEV